MQNLEDTCADLLLGLIPIISGVTAQLTRSVYIAPYTNEINYQQFVPIVYLNIIEDHLTIANTLSIQFTTGDMFTASDWVVLNEVPTP